ncbi:MAG TPA: helix-turn-helix domain-containing protein [Steroidobacteraceae bacterium]|nr:helix-turn-helix domain-containing protein [Steroidobacteraceae bacterium]
MLACASRLFAAKGHQKTTFEEIARASGVGVATVYNHFQTKEGIVAALLRPDLEKIFAEGERVLAKPPADPATAMVRLLSAYRDLGGHNWKRRELLRSVILPGVGNQGFLTELVVEADARTQAQIRALLRRHRQRRQLKASLPIEDASAVIFALLNQHFALFLTQPRLRFAAMFRMLSRRVRLVFDDWRR